MCVWVTAVPQTVTGTSLNELKKENKSPGLAKKRRKNSTFKPTIENDDTETSSSDTSDDDDV